jgi:hypothetical protein
MGVLKEKSVHKSPACLLSAISGLCGFYFFRGSSAGST